MHIEAGNLRWLDRDGKTQCWLSWRGFRKRTEEIHPGSICLLTIKIYKDIPLCPRHFPKRWDSLRGDQRPHGLCVQLEAYTPGFMCSFGRKGREGSEQINKQLISEGEFECPERRSVSRVGDGGTFDSFICPPGTLVVIGDWQEEWAGLWLGW